MSVAYAGIDPGLSGAVAIISPDGTVRVWDMPVIEMQIKKRAKTGGTKMGAKNIPDEHQMVTILEGLLASTQYAATSVHVTLEKVNAMPSIDGGRRTMGATSMFNFGFGYGLWCMALTALKLSHERVHPATWKAAVLRGTNKDDGAVAQVAGQLYPAANHLLRGPRGGLMIGRVDALLIAHYGKVMGETPIPIS